MISCNVIAPQFFWIRKLRRSPMALFIISIFVNIGMWFERFVIVVTTLARDFVTSSWGYFSPTAFDWWEFDEDLAEGEVERLTIESPDGVVVGLIQFAEEDDPDYRHAGLDIYVDPTHHRKGFASDAIRTLVTHLLDDRGHHRLTIDPSVDNEAAIACYAGVGFEPVGVMRAYERRPDGTWGDGLLMELVAEGGAGPR